MTRQRKHLGATPQPGATLAPFYHKERGNTMTDETMKALGAIREQINSRPVTDFVQLTKSKGADMYNCPICGSGTGKNKTGALKLYRDTNRIICNANGCFGAKGEDTLGALRIIWGCTEQEAMTRAGYTLDAYKGKQPQKTQQTQKTYEAPEKDYSDYFQQMAANVEGAEGYLSSRHISLDTARRFNLGYDVRWIHPDVVERQRAKGSDWIPPASRRLIIPTGKGSYVARAIDPDAEYQKQKVGKMNLFNTKALQNAGKRPVFVTEGEIDALSVVEAGGESCALGSTSNAGKLIEYLKERPTECTLILSLDNDEAGKECTRKLSDGLKMAGISFTTANIAGTYKDANEALCGDPDAFQKAIRAAEQKASAAPDGVASYMAQLMGQEISEFSRASETKTGFPRFDQLTGGIFPGLYVMAAISSLGKTTFIHQMADQMAAAGKHVLFFSLEMSRLEMVSKSISRKMAQLDYSNAITSLKIRRGTTSNLTQRAAKEYAEGVGDRLSIIEGGFDTTVSFIGEYVRRYIEQNNTRPVVIVDYLQIIQGAQKATIREATDFNVVELKRMTRALDIPVIVISSVNRGNYLLPVDFESIKESGGIEYTADVVLGLQLACLDEDIFTKENKIKEKRERIKAAKGETPREVKLVCLKNRYGSPDWTIDYKYYSQYDLFEEQGGYTVVNEKTPWD